MRLGLVLSGGGARGAYQAGSLKALVQILADMNKLHELQVLTGISAGAINASFLGAYADDMVKGADELCRVWQNIHPDDVYRTDLTGLGKIGLKIITDVAFGSMAKKKLASSLLDTAPLRKLLTQNIDFTRIKAHGEKQKIYVACSAFDYDQSIIRIFTDGSPDMPSWQRPRRMSEKVELNVEHIMASSAIPMLFPPIEINGKYYGDGSLRNTAPISPAINMGADRIIIIGVRNPEHMADMISGKKGRPTIGRTFGLMLNALFFDTVDSDVERLNHVNGILENVEKGKGTIRPVANMWIRPNEDLGKLALEYINGLPTSVGYLLGGIGGKKESSEIASYLLFDPTFTSKLVDMGYKDTWDRKEELAWFLSEN